MQGLRDILLTLRPERMPAYSSLADTSLAKSFSGLRMAIVQALSKKPRSKLLQPSFHNQVFSLVSVSRLPSKVIAAISKLSVLKVVLSDTSKESGMVS